MTPRTIGLIALGLALAGGLGYMAFRTDPVPVDLHTVERGPMQVTVVADGKTRIREIYQVASPIAGTLRRAPVHVGDLVVEGETVVAMVEPVAPSLLDARSRIQAEAAQREAEAALAVADSGLRQAEEDFAYAQSQYDRTQALVERGVASVTRLEDAAQLLALKQAAREAASSNRDMAQGAVDRAAAALIEPSADPGTRDGACCVEIRAPATGTVLAISEESERPIAAGAPILSIGDPGDLEIVADLLSSDAVRLTIGSRAIVERWGGPNPLEARLASTEPIARTKVSALGIEEQRVDAVFDLLSPPEARAGLGQGYAVFLRIVEWEADDVLRVPLSTLFRSGDGWAVFAVADGIARKVPVEVGRRSDTDAEILSGLETGQRLVTHPSEAVTDGVEVTERTEI